ncbi:MAG: DUF5778 family protein [Natronomonas sp.]|jgi:hypothetical protein|uniref:Uncharacterized protein n=1 Tax=Natronomonas salsuginis TaxID=2217661 RepID=A0A4U5JI87_9EURY|nr:MULTISPECIES: DUF5778 family protein [Natronomonas]MDR9381369.1 DUF5778 family protein [Natronomonas sp.]MDR9431532.1 DUF5778 family protein [Natronomonas sp.]TKR28226.1 hypothetical protein DM868_03910 [Natronomonas salsuginis]
MSEAIDDDLYQRTKALLEPGDIRLNGVIVDTELTNEEEPTLHQATLDIGDVIAEAAGIEPTDTYVYSGNDDDRFGVNQHQGLTLDGEEFVWECQQLIRDSTYDIVFYYEADADQAAIVRGVEELGFGATGVEGE